MNKLAVNVVLESSESNHMYRILWISPECAETYIFNLNTLEMPQLLSYSDLIRQIDSEVFAVKEVDPYLIVRREAELTEAEKEIRDKIWSVMGDAVIDEPRIFTKSGRGELLSSLMEVTGKNLMTLHRYLKTYWQRGKTKDAFIPQFRNREVAGKERNSNEMKRGRPRKYEGGTGINIDDATKVIFEKVIKKYYHTRNGYTLKYAYEMMLKEYYMRFVALPDGKKNRVAGLLFKVNSEGERSRFGRGRFTAGFPKKK